MIPTFAERLEAYAAEVRATVLRTKEVPVGKFGVSSNASKERNAKALNSAIASIDDGTILRFGSRIYPIDQGAVRGMRGSIELRGDGYQRSILEYTSITDNTVGVGNCITVGIDKPELVPAGATGVCKDITVRGLGFRDLNKVAFDFAKQTGHWPAALEFLFVENPLVDGCGFWNVKGNSALNVLGYGRNNFTPVTQRCTVQNCWFGGDPLGGYTQGDGVNAAAYATLIMRGNRTSGGIRRHFMELGTAVTDLVVEDNVGDLQGMGLAHLGSWTSTRSASIRRNIFSNWGAAGGASSIPIIPDAPQYDQNGNSVFTAPDGTPLPLNQVVGVVVEDNTFNAGSACWTAAITIEAGDIRDHAYRRNSFNCPLAFYITQQPTAPFEISANDFTPDAAGRSFIALAAALAAPSGPVMIGGNTLRKGAKLFDSGSWATDPRVSGVSTNLLG